MLPTWMPASLAMSRSEVAWKPSRANRRSAVSMISSRVPLVCATAATSGSPMADQIIWTFIQKGDPASTSDIGASGQAEHAGPPAIDLCYNRSRHARVAHARRHRDRASLHPRDLHVPSVHRLPAAPDDPRPDLRPRAAGGLGHGDLVPAQQRLLGGGGGAVSRLFLGGDGDRRAVDRPPAAR